MLFGNKKIFAIECEGMHHVDSMIFGKLRMWLEGQAIGDCTEEVIGLASTTGMLKDSLSLLNEPVPAALTNLSDEELLTEIWTVMYGDVYHETKFNQYRSFVWFEQCAGFESQRSIRIPVENGQKIIWQYDNTPTIHSTVIPTDVYTSVITDFLNWLDNNKSANSAHCATVTITKLVEDSLPALVEFSLTDIYGKNWLFIDKAPVITLDDITKETVLPKIGQMAVEVIKEWDHDGEKVVTINTAKPWDIESTEGQQQFDVLAEQIKQEDI